MSIVHVAFYPSDWLAGTRGLSAEETGVYITLIARMYEMAAPIERDDNRLSRLCGTKSKASFVKALDYLISEGKVTETEDGLFNDRVEKEIQNTTEKSSKAKAAAETRWRKKANKNNKGKNADASPEHMPQTCQSEPEPDIKEETKVSSKKKRASRLPDDWVLPGEYGEWALSEGWPEQAIRLEADKFRDFWISKSGKDAAKLDWLATWRNWMRNSKTPKIIQGGGNGKPADNADRLQRTITAAATGTSHKDWG